MVQNQASVNIKGTVVEVGAEGIHVLLEDGRKGFIPEVEISLDHRVRAARKMFAPGDAIYAVVLPDKDHHDRLYLSLRMMSDLWQAVTTQKKYKVGQTVTGEVVNIRSFGAFVQLEPGIDAVLWPKDIPLLKDQAINDLLGVGDRVIAKISQIDYANHKIEISLIKYLKDLSSLSYEHHADILWKTFAVNPHPSEEQPESNPDADATAAPVIGKDDFVRQLGMQALAQQPLRVVLSRILTWLCSKTGIPTGFVIEVDQGSRLVYIRATEPAMTKQQIDLLQDGLYYSPAVQVTTGVEIIDNNTTTKTGDRYKNFFPSLDYQSWLGVPVEIIGQEPHFGLVLLGEGPLAFNERSEQGRRIIDMARTASYFLATAIQQSALLDYMQRYDERYGMGQLIGDMIHETNHEVNKFSLSLGALKTHIKCFGANGSAEQIKDWRDQLDIYIDNLDHCLTELSEINESYKRQAEAKFEAVDINLTVKQVVRQLKYTSKNMQIKFFTYLDPALPHAFGIQTHVKQMIYNLALNGMQMIVIQREKIHKYCDRVDQPGLLQQPSVMVIETNYHGPDAERPIEVRVCDSGPGIHARHQKRIFQNAYSERKQGEGRGLAISRNLAERMGGKLDLRDSVLFFGSVFSIEMLQCPEKLEDQNA